MALHYFHLKKSFIALAAFMFLFQLITAKPVWAESASGKTQISSPVSAAGENGDGAANAGAWEGEEGWESEWETPKAIADPLEPLNRLFFHFNDKLYYWVLKPVARVYSGIIPEDMQIVIRNIFYNLRSPIRAVNSLLQGNMGGAASEVARFALNSTVGILGAGDFARDAFGLRTSNEDLGQTFGFYGSGGGFYINWPFLGPSNFRDSLGLLGDTYIHPLFLLDADWNVIIGAWTFEKVNYTALTRGDYELFTETALDPYTAVKDAYQQYRNGLIKNK